MNKNILRRAKHAFILQEGQSECGPTCLSIVGRFLGHPVSPLDARLRAGTSRTGTTLHGLLLAAQQLGFSAEGLRGNSLALRTHEDPCILFVTVENGLQHFVAHLGFDGKKHIIADPAKGVLTLNEDELDALWPTKRLLSISSQHGSQKRSPKMLSLSWRKGLEFVGVPILFGVIVSGLGYALAFYVKGLLDDVLPERNISRLFELSILMLFLLLVRAVINYYRATVVNILHELVSRPISRRYLTNLMSLPQEYFDGKNTSEIQSKFLEGQRIAQIYQVFVSNLLVDLSMFIITFIFLFVFLNFITAALTLVSIIALAALLYFRANSINKLQKQVAKSSSILELTFSEITQNITLIKTSALFKTVTQQFNRTVDEAMGDRRSYATSVARFNLLLDICASVVLISLLAHIGILAIHGGIEAGNLLFYIFLVGSLITSAPRLVVSLIEVMEAKVLFSGNTEFLRSATQLQSPVTPHPAQNVPTFTKLEVKDVTFRYIGRKALYERLNVEFTKGKMYCVVGRSGSGKSTLLKLLVGLLKPQSGCIKVNEGKCSFQEAISVSFQSPQIMYGSVLYNIALSSEQAMLDSALAFIEENGAMPYIAQLPYGAATIVGSGGMQISAGQSQLICLLRALFQNKPLILLDEPTASMDRELERFCCDLLRWAVDKQGSTVVVFSHSEIFIEISDETMALEQGKLERLAEV